mgnify:CR=1 FL=1
MIYPAYIDTIQSITLLDPLSEFLGVFEDGEVTFTYLDIVKNAGHSCPTVAGAYMMALYGLKRLYKESIPVRGEIVVSFSTELSEGVTGVVANVMTHITGATQNSGFKGIQGNFSRVGLMHFSEDFKADVKLTRVDTQESILVTYDATLVPPEKEQMMLMRKIIQKNATPDEKALFKEMWQRRVEKILSSGNLVISITKC